MNDCPSLPGCPFFNDKMAMDSESIKEMFKKRYCKSDYTKCARWNVATSVGKEKVPINLFPNQKNRVDKIINDSK